MFSFWKKDREKENLLLVDQLNLRAQLENQIKILQKIGVLELPVPTTPEATPVPYFTGINGQKYPVPSFEEISERIKTKEPFLRLKAEQGFTKLLLVPLGYSLDKFIEKYEELIRWHYANNKLFYLKGTEEVRQNLNKDNPLNVWNEYNEADINNYLIYFPKIFKKENHEGKTKKELLTNSENAWLVLLVPEALDIPKKNKGKTFNERPELESGKSPDDYLRIIQKELPYEGEIGLPPEASIMHDITRLEETNHLVNDWLRNGSIEYNLGAFFATTENIPWSSWNSDFNRADLWKANSWNKDEFMGTRTGVKI